MGVAEDKAAALAQMKLYVDYNTDPKLTTGTDNSDLETILAGCLRARYWAAETEYKVGDVIQPTTNKHGRRYVCIQAGTSGEAEPERWQQKAVGRVGYTVTDNDVVWREDGPSYANVYDTRLAIHLAWRMKSGRASGYYNFGDSTQKFEVEKVRQHCDDEAQKWAPIDF